MKIILILLCALVTAFALPQTHADEITIHAASSLGAPPKDSPKSREPSPGSRTTSAPP